LDYTAIYERLVEVAKSRPTPAVTEKHHVIPKCMGGSDDPENLVLLTPREHLFAHKLLVRIHPNSFKLHVALILMGRLVEYKSKIFESERIRAAELRRQFRYSQKSKQKMSESARKRGRNSPATEFKPGFKPWNKGLPVEESHRYGTKHSPETIQKMKETQRRLSGKQSERMKLWWAERKKKLASEHERVNP
jgi:hypothetical protein